jgi:hypothetical protein
MHCLEIIVGNYRHEITIKARNLFWKLLWKNYWKIAGYCSCQATVHARYCSYNVLFIPVLCTPVTVHAKYCSHRWKIMVGYLPLEIECWGWRFVSICFHESLDTLLWNYYKKSMPHKELQLGKYRLEIISEAKDL